MVTAFDVAGDPETQASLEVISQLIWSLLNGLKVKRDELGPVIFPLTFHWYSGASPPLTGVAVNMTLVPAQTGFNPAATDTLTGDFEMTVIEI